MLSRQTGKAASTAAPYVVAAPIVGAEDNDASALKRQLLWRMGLAGLMILALLAALAVFDAANTPDEPVAPQFSEPVPVRKRELAQAPTPAEPPAQAAAVVPVPAETAASAAPVVRSGKGPAVVVPGSPAVVRPVLSPAVAPPATAMPTASAGGAIPSAAEPLPPAPPPPGTGYTWQSSVISDPARAEEVQAKLAQEGIPASVEMRLRVGPFRSRGEAEAARRKLQTLGLDTLTLLGPASKH